VPGLQRAPRQQGEQRLQLAPEVRRGQEPQQRFRGARAGDVHVRIGRAGRGRGGRRPLDAHRGLGRHADPDGGCAVGGLALPCEQLAEAQRHLDPQRLGPAEVAGTGVDPAQPLGDHLRQGPQHPGDEPLRVRAPAPAAVADDPDHAAVDDDLVGVHHKLTFAVPLGV